MSSKYKCIINQYYFYTFCMGNLILCSFSFNFVLKTYSMGLLYCNRNTKTTIKKVVGDVSNLTWDRIRTFILHSQRRGTQECVNMNIVLIYLHNPFICKIIIIIVTPFWTNGTQWNKKSQISNNLLPHAVLCLLFNEWK